MSLLIKFYASFLQNEPKSSNIANELLQSAKTSTSVLYNLVTVMGVSDKLL
ncbi:hypothetical protein TTHERM_000225938 (macronuclear) [Tetrahymena thermophila SB210]|uniref:Uncharacterized protein n=1 Tax=Tetrahymena thermophila (strain SB210) TaxID=312017 RepID=W7XBK9_TETTS|nr:hypothetical protein TTHERM_000225938 [Tetrahymena thermophila SB210]EWS74727.1 hypothetical protein TTHERM_000225938 [Tetrahymena thermophila SB210]|eukprot:XP_012652728.1 hypothetical protein TTHERM_000225938 [Tetrahymena thermophila SB210]